MVSKSSAKKVVVRALPEDLDASIGEAVRAAPGSTSAQLMKALPPSYRAFAKEVRAAAERLADAGELHRHLKGKTPLFFASDPLAALDAAIPTRVASNPVDKEDLKRLAGEVLPAYALVLDTWLKGALARRVLYEHAPASKGAKKRYGREPDVRKLVAPLLVALRKAGHTFDAQGISRERLAEIVLQEIGVSLERAGVPASGRGKEGSTVANGNGRPQFLAVLAALGAENPRQALLSVRDLRSRLGLGKQQFDALALDLMREGAISLHHHDHPASLPEPERNELVQDARGTHYIGIALRRGP